MTVDIAAFNDAWLAAWSDKDVTRLVSFYTHDALYIDPQVPQGVRGSDALAEYLTKLFASTPRMRFRSDQTWQSADGYFGRWYCEIDGQTRRLRGFDVVTLRGDRIAFNEVYTHSIESPA
jgi:ketosteroid isomerase-like protein